jgi:hypothetical protein
MQQQIKTGSIVSIRERNGQVIFGKYEKEGRNGYHRIKTDDGRTFDRKIDKIKFVDVAQMNLPTIQTSDSINDIQKPSLLNPPKQFNINDKFRFLENMIKMVIKKTAVSMIITGEGGLGKSYIVSQEVAKKQLTEGYDYIIVKGYSTARGLYRTLYENSDKLIIFDDCDEVLKDATAKNILKGALDSYDVRKINWITSKELPDLPNEFEFEGQIIFISNLAQEKIEQALLSRSMSIDLSMTTEVKIERMRAILPKIKPSVPLDLKEECLNLVEEYKDQCGDLNFRTLIKVISMRIDPENSEDWKDMAIYAMTSTVN